MKQQLYFSDQTQPELMDLGFRRIQPHRALRPYVDCYWLIDANLDMVRSENFYLDGGSGFLFNFDSPIQNHGQAIDSSVFQNVDRVKSEVTFCGPTRALGVRFFPGGAQAFFDYQLGQINGPLHRLGDLSPEFGALSSGLRQLSSWPERIRRLETTLLRLKRDLPHRHVLQLCRSLFHSKKIPPSMEQLTVGLGISERQLQRIFKHRVGLSPKQLLRLHRIDRIRLKLKQQNIPSLTELAYESGFYDQAHFIREFKQVTGMTPGHYRRRAITRYLYPPSK